MSGREAGVRATAGGGEGSVPGWDVADRRALYDGRPLKVAASRLRLLRVLVEADGPVPAAELIRTAFDQQTSEDNVRYHVRQLNKELRAAFGDDLDFDPVTGTGEGYRLTLR